jgi:hypothetical protein
VVDFSKIHVITKEEESKLLPPKKHKNYDKSHGNVEMCGLFNSHGQKC